MSDPRSFETLWASGEVWRLAAQSRTARELAERLGMSSDALTGRMRRLRARRPDVPPDTATLIYEAQRLGAGRTEVKRDDTFVSGEAANDDWDEPTRPDISIIQKVDIHRDAPALDTLDPVDEHRLKRRVRELAAENKAILDRLASAQDRLSLIAEANSTPIEPIRPRERPGGPKHEATAVFLVSDLHLEELVTPGKVLGLNRFNLDIARLRMRRLFERMRWFLDRQRVDFIIRDVCLWLGGDSFTGHLHPDNVESTLLAPPAAYAFAKQLLGDGIDFLLEDPLIERCALPCNDGNHSRLTKELRAATRAEHSLETLMYGELASKYKGDPRVQFEIAQGDRLYTQIYNLSVRWTHGAEVKSGGGIGGVMIPLYRAMSRWETERKADLTCLGHFHQRTSLRDLEVNSSLIGFSPYAMRIGARFEEPTQSAFLIDSQRGKGISSPLWVSSPEEEIALWNAWWNTRQAA